MTWLHQSCVGESGFVRPGLPFEITGVRSALLQPSRRWVRTRLAAWPNAALRGSLRVRGSNPKAGPQFPVSAFGRSDESNSSTDEGTMLDPQMRGSKCHSL